MSASSLAAARPTARDFQPGALYPTGYVARLFGRTTQWVRDQIKAKRLRGDRLPGGRDYLIAGGSVLELYGALKLAEDVAGEAMPQSAAEVSKRAKKRLMELQQLNGRGG